MENEITYRHNIMEIQSIEAFINIKGGFNHQVRDVYFVRAIGVPAHFPDVIRKMDQRMGKEMADGHLKYMRVKALPSLAGVQESAFYAGAYDAWKSDGTPALRNIKVSGAFARVFSRAVRQVIGMFEKSRSNSSESIVRNFVAKIMYWFDVQAAELVSGWNERAVMKVAAENVLKEQEYLFYYFLTMLGCDVLLLQYKKDMEAPEVMKALSSELVLGSFDTCALPEYVPYVHEEKAVESRPVKVIIPERKGRRSSRTEAQGANPQRVNPQRANPQRADTQGANPQRVNPQRADTQRANPQRVKPNRPAPASDVEKGFEELAQLASSIVMISVHDHRGEIRSTGSGIMIGRGGYILTNNHVASGGVFYSVSIEDDEETYQTDEVIKYNGTLDLAVIRIQRQLDPLPIYRGRKKLVRGQKVVAIGSPLGLFNSVSDGIISGFRKIRDIDMIQFTAPISPGSSGGAVLNMQGEVIGISTAGIDSGQNINLAVGYENILMFANGFFS